MSLLYCTVALILGCTYADAGQGSVQGTTGLSPIDKAFACLNALGSIGFACEPQRAPPANGHLACGRPVPAAELSATWLCPLDSLPQTACPTCSWK